MARPTVPIRFKRTNPLVVLIGAVIAFLIILFVVLPSREPTNHDRHPVDPASHQLSPPTLPYRKGVASQRPPPVTHYNLNNVNITSDPLSGRETVLILSPMARFYPEYWENLVRLTYPHELITLGFILPKTKEGNAATAALQESIARTQRSPRDRFRSIIILREESDPAPESQDEAVRHRMDVQKARRAGMAKARNALLFTTLGPLTSWVLWLDADVIETPPTIIQDLAGHDKEVLAANCFQRYYDTETKKMAERPYDFNNWQDSETANELAQNMGPDDILLEGYHDMATYRTLMAYVKENEGDRKFIIPLDGVGGSALLVKAEVHRDGAMFPAFPFYHLIETEGFAKMTKRLGRHVWGLPNYKVYHYNE